jgi:hypothetical protein
MNPNLDPEAILNLFAKNVDVAGYAGPIPSSLLARQDLEAEIIKLTNRNTPLRDMIPRIKGEGRAHLWNQRIALGGLPNRNNPIELFYLDGALPTQSDPVYTQKTAAYAYLGVKYLLLPLLVTVKKKLCKFGESLKNFVTFETIPSQAFV